MKKAQQFNSARFTNPMIGALLVARLHCFISPLASTVVGNRRACAPRAPFSAANKDQTRVAERRNFLFRINNCLKARFRARSFENQLPSNPGFMLPHPSTQWRAHSP
jgi:hypothetical protein